MVPECDECETPLIPHEHCLVCPSCGLLHDQSYRTRTPIPGFKQRLGSMMAMTNYNTRQGSNSNERIHEKYRKLSDLQDSIYRGSYLDVFRLTQDLQSIAKELLVPTEVVESTMSLFFDITSKVRNPYNSHALLLAVCFLKVTREKGNQAPVKIAEVAEAFSTRGHKFSPRLLAKTLYYASNLMPMRKFRSCEDCLGKVIQRLGQATFLRVRANAVAIDIDEYLSQVERLSTDLLGCISPVKRSGRNPFLLAASSVYASSAVISKQKGIASLFTKTEFSREVGIAEYTLRSHLAEIFNKEMGNTPCVSVP